MAGVKQLKWEAEREGKLNVKRRKPLRKQKHGSGRSSGSLSGRTVKHSAVKRNSKMNRRKRRN